MPHLASLASSHIEREPTTANNTTRLPSPLGRPTKGTLPLSYYTGADNVLVFMFLLIKANTIERSAADGSGADHS